MILRELDNLFIFHANVKHDNILELHFTLTDKESNILNSEHMYIYSI